MYTPALLGAVLPLISVALAHPVKPRAGNDFTVTSLSGTFPISGPYGDENVDSHLTFAITYPDASNATLSTSCTANWPSGTDPAPTAWAACDDELLQFRLPTDGWTSFANFELELWATLTEDGSGLDASHLITFNPGNPSDPNSYMFCVQRGKFTPYSCDLTGPYGQSARTLVITPTEGSAQPL